jgi:hypothetical protein
MQRVKGSYRPWQTGCLGFFGLVFIVGGLAALVIPALASNVVSFDGGQLQFDLDSDGLIPIVSTMACVGLPLGGVGLLMIGAAVRTLLARARVSPPEVSLSNAAPRVGEIFTVDYQQTYRVATNVQLIRLSLILRESATYQRGTDSVTVTHDHFVQTYDLPPRQFTAGETFQERRQFQIPPLGMHSFAAHRNKLYWCLKVLVQIPGWPDFDDEFGLTVPPQVAR